MAAKPSSPVPNLQELVICSVCLEDFTDPRALPCVHSYCKACLERLITPEGKITCPECRIEVEVPDRDVSKLSPNFVMNSLLDMLSLTNEVTTTHHGDSADTPHCPSHEGRECELYCNDCSKLICFQCIVKWGDCHDHSYKDVTETADKFRENMQMFSEKRKLLLPTFEQHLSLLQGMKAQQVANTAEVCERIEESFQRHIASLNIRKNKLVGAACAAQLQEEEDRLLTELDRVQLERAKLANTVEFCEKIMEIENPAMFVEKYSEVREKFFEADIPELFSHIDVRDVRFKENEALLRDVILSYGEIVNKDAPSEEKPSVPGPSDHGMRERVAGENPRPLRQAESLPNIQRYQGISRNDGGNGGAIGGAAGGATGGPSGAASTSATAREQNGGSMTRAASMANNCKHEPVFWKICLKKWNAQVSIDDKKLSVQSQSPSSFSVLGMPGFRNGKHSWKVKLEHLGTVVGIGVCLGKNAPGLCVMFDPEHGSSMMVTVELDCEAKLVKVKPAGRLGNTLGFENQVGCIHPYFLLSFMNGNGKMTIVEMDGKSADDAPPGCSIL